MVHWRIKMVNTKTDDPLQALEVIQEKFLSNKTRYLKEYDLIEGEKDDKQSWLVKKLCTIGIYDWNINYEENMAECTDISNLSFVVKITEEMPDIEKVKTLPFMIGSNHFWATPILIKGEPDNLSDSEYIADMIEELKETFNISAWNRSRSA